MALAEHLKGFDYPLHIDERRGRPCDLDGVPTIPRAAHDWMTSYGEHGLDGAMERQCDEAIEAACWVILNRRLAQLRKEETVVVPQGDDEDDDCYGK